MRFLLALLVGCAYRIGSEAIGLVRALMTRREVPEPLRSARLESCRQCRLFYHPLKTCGSPLLPKAQRHLGCHCYMPKKAGQNANCWAYDMGLGYGWPKRLNSVIR